MVLRIKNHIRNLNDQQISNQPKKVSVRVDGPKNQITNEMGDIHIHLSGTEVDDSEIEDAMSCRIMRYEFAEVGAKSIYKNPLHRTSIQRNKKYNKPLTAKETSNPISPVVRAMAPINHTWFIQGIATPKDSTLAAPAAIPDGRRLGTFHVVMSYSEGLFLRK